MHRIVPHVNEMYSFLKGATASLFTFCISYFYPIQDFFKVIMILATLNIIFGWAADTTGWSFKKAFTAFLYLGGYIMLLALSLIVGKLMHQPEISISEFLSWITWVMIYFYGTNILRNWHLKQPDNKPIAFLYWVVTFKILEKIKYLKEFKEYNNKKNNDNGDL